MDSDNDYGTKDFLYDPKFPIKKTKISKMLKVENTKTLKILNKMLKVKDAKN